MKLVFEVYIRKLHVNVWPVKGKCEGMCLSRDLSSNISRLWRHKVGWHTRNSRVHRFLLPQEFSELSRCSTFSHIPIQSQPPNPKSLAYSSIKKVPVLKLKVLHSIWRKALCSYKTVSMKRNWHGMVKRSITSINQRSHKYQIPGRCFFIKKYFFMYLYHVLRLNFPVD